MVYYDTDILISGGGLAGLVTAASFGKAGFRVICVDPASEVPQQDGGYADLRTTALLQSAIPLLERAGLWHRLLPYATPLQAMRIADAGQEEQKDLRFVKDFNAAEISDLPFGWNIQNVVLRREIMAFAKMLETVVLLTNTHVSRLMTRDKEARVSLSDGQTLKAKLVIGADGRHSTVRELLSIPVKTKRYGQKALVFLVTHLAPHDNISTEVHRSGGPFTLVPLPDHKGQHTSAVVWMDEAAEVTRLMGLSKAAFEAALNERSGNVLGHLSCLGQLESWPIISQIADRIIDKRVALIAEAAHVLPPIGAQGLNMSLADIASLLDLAVAAPDDIGSVRMLHSYQQKRQLEIKARMMGVDMLNRASMAKAQPLRDARAMALNALHSVTPLRQFLMKAGLGMC